MPDEASRPRKRRRRFAPLDESRLAPPLPANATTIPTVAPHATEKKPPPPPPAVDSTRKGKTPLAENGDELNSNTRASEIPAIWPPCRSVELYQRLNFIDEGTYGRVYRARELATGTIYALKQVKVTQERDGFPITSLREISALFAVSHPNVVALKEVVVGSGSHNVYMVLEYAAHDLQSILDRMRRPYSASEAKSLVLQLLRGVAHLHASWVMHRDLKPANLLLTAGGVLKICDFGLARPAPEDDRRTPGVTTLWYRAPEVLLADNSYTGAIDMWSVGCIIAELVLMKPILQGSCEIDQIRKICELLGPPREECWSGLKKLRNAQSIAFPPLKKGIRDTLVEGVAFLSPAGVDLVEKLLCYDPEKRITAEEAIDHIYFKEMPPTKNPALIQTFPDDRRG